MAPLENLSRNYFEVKGKRQRKITFVITENLMRTNKSFPQIKRSENLRETVTIVTVKFRGLLVCYYTTVFTFAYGLKSFRSFRKPKTC